MKLSDFLKENNAYDNFCSSFDLEFQKGDIVCIGSSFDYTESGYGTSFWVDLNKKWFLCHNKEYDMDWLIKGFKPNPNLSQDYRFEKMVKNYEKFGSLVIGVDFDFTLNDPVTKETYLDMVHLIKRMNQHNFKICIWTANEDREYVEDVPIPTRKYKFDGDKLLVCYLRCTDYTPSSLTLKDYIDMDFIELACPPTEVSWVDALKAYKDGDEIYCMNSNRLYSKYVPFKGSGALKDVDGQAITVQELFNMKWYIGKPIIVI